MAAAVTQADVARAAGVNRATVSRALDPARRHLINPATVERIETVSRELGFQPNAMARGLKTRRSGVIAVVIRAELSPYAQVTLLRAVDEALAVTSHFPLVIHHPEGSKVEDHPTLGAARGLIDGALVVTTQTGPEPTDPVTFPVVTFGVAPATTSDVVLDEAAGVRLALQHLARLGHERIAFICEPAGTPRGALFLDTYRATCQQLFGRVDEDLVDTFSPSRPASGRDACAALFHRGAHPTAILATDDAAAMGCYGVLRQLGLTVGRDVSVVGMGNTPQAAFVEPPMTTMALPLAAAGAKAAELLVEAIERGEQGGNDHVTTVFAPYLLQRMSSVEHPHSS